MLNIVLGNVFSIFALISDSISASKQNSKDILLMQTLGQAFYAISSILLKGYSAAVQNVVSIFRNFVAINENTNKYLEWFLVGLGVGLGLYFNNLGLIGLLPIVANLEYSIAVFKYKNNKYLLKISFLIMVLLFCIFNFIIFNIVGAISNLILISTTVINLKKENN